MIEVDSIGETAPSLFLETVPTIVLRQECLCYNYSDFPAACRGGWSAEPRRFHTAWRPACAKPKLRFGEGKGTMKGEAAPPTAGRRKRETPSGFPL
jgi:hypothetical protein